MRAKSYCRPLSRQNLRIALAFSASLETSLIAACVSFTLSAFTMARVSARMRGFSIKLLYADNVPNATTAPAMPPTPRLSQLNMSDFPHENEDQKHNQDYPDDAEGAISPILRVRPMRRRAK